MGGDPVLVRFSGKGTMGAVEAVGGSKRDTEVVEEVLQAKVSVSSNVHTRNRA
jgi:hypothetical protein